MKRFKTIERQDPNTGAWRAHQFESLKRGDVFRVVDGLSAGESGGPLVCKSDAVEVPDEPENYQVRIV